MRIAACTIGIMLSIWGAGRALLEGLAWANLFMYEIEHQDGNLVQHEIKAIGFLVLSMLLGSACTWLCLQLRKLCASPPS